MALNRKEKRFLGFVVIPLCVVIVAAVTTGLLGYDGLSQLISIGGTLGVLIFAMLYIVFIDPKKRWPGLTPFQRYAKVVTFDK